MADRFLQAPSEVQQGFAQTVDNFLRLRFAGDAHVQDIDGVVDDDISKAPAPEVDAAFPGRRAARVTVTLRDGHVLTHLQPDRKGDPDCRFPTPIWKAS